MKGLVLIHGFTGSPASFDELARRLLSKRPRLRLHRPALLGHGGSSPASVQRFEDEVDRLAADIIRAGFAGSHLCGYSLGARVALGLLARHGFVFSGATLIGVHPGLTTLEERAARVGGDERWCELLSKRGVAAFLDAWQEQPVFASQRVLPERAAAEQRRIRASHGADGLMRALRVLGLGQMPNYRGALANVAGPLRLVVGEQDAKFLALARKLVETLPNARLDLVPGVGHNVLLEAPGHLESALLRDLGS